MKNLTTKELELTRKCVQSALRLRTDYVTTMSAGERIISSVSEPSIKRKYARFVATEIPQLTSLLNKLGGKAK